MSGPPRPGPIRETIHGAVEPEAKERHRQTPPDGAVPARVWLDHRGRLFEAPADAHTCRDSAGRARTHRLWRPTDPLLLVPQTVCGQRAGDIPGEGDVDCPDCLAVEQSRSTPGQ